MSEAIVAKRYADALFELGKEKNTLDQFVEEFQVVREVFQQDAQLNTFLEHPRIHQMKKKQMLEKAFQSMNQDVVNTLLLLLERDRVQIVPSMIDHLIQRVNDAKGIAEATVYSVRELSDSEQQELEKTIAKRFQIKSVTIHNIVDPSIIGGIRVRVGNTIMDGSISGKLKRMEREIASANN
ncbi:MAG TPA: F0F1 ATP synthase subunit delta [Bacillota bacterium]